MSSPTFDSLRRTLRNLRRRRNFLFVLKQVSITLIAVIALILALSLVGVWLELGRGGNIALFGLGAIAVVLLFALQIRKFRFRYTDDKHLAHYVEEHIPDLEQRLLTSLEFNESDLIHGRKGVSQQFIRQLWVDAQQHVREQQKQVETVTPASSSWASLGAAGVTMVAASALLLNFEGLLNASSRLLWPFAITEPVQLVETPVIVELSVEPGDLELQRGDSVTVIAKVVNAIPGSLDLRLQEDNVNWRDVTMSRDGSGSESANYSYFIPSLQEDTTYYVTFNEGSGEYSSPQYRISLFDLPQIEQIDIAYDYPDYTGLEDQLEENSGDMVVPEGTQVELTVTFNKAIANSILEFDEPYLEEGEEAPATAYENMPLQIEGNVGKASFTVMQDGVYRISATDFENLESSNPLDYFVRSIEDMPPQLELKQPGRDQEVMPLEEVALEVAANDDYGLSEFTLNYSVIGQDEVAIDFLNQPNAIQVDGSEMLYLEDLQVEPGDFVSYFLTLADNNSLQGPNQVISDIYFLQVVPTDQEFRRGQGGGGGGGGGGGQGGDASALVSIQKDVIAATWKLRNRQDQVSPAEFGSDAEIIAQSQQEATDRARMSIDRLAERLSFSDESYDNAVENLSQAIEQMNLAVVELDKEQVNSALKPEQLALQYILKAEADINRTSVSMQQQGGGGGGGGAQQEREDLRELFEMELGQLENRYENPNSQGGGGGPQSEEENKLEELARRQEGLTRAQRNLARREDQMTEEQKRRELERLMRQQEQLSQEVAQLSQQLSRGQQQSQSQQQSQQSQQSQGQQSQSQSQASSQSQSQSSGGGGGQQQQPQTALQRAAQQMQEAAESETAAIAAARSQKALENLRQQQQQMSQESESSVNQLAQNLSQRGQRLLQQQRQLQEQLQDASRQQGLGQTRQSVRNNEDLQGLLEAQQQQQRDLEEIEDMLRAVIARGDNDDQRLMSQAQEASRELRPIREEMMTSNRVLRNGMVNLSVDIERELEGQIEDFSQSLQALNPSRQGNGSDQIQQVAQSAEELKEQIEALEQQALAFNEAGQQPGQGAPTVREMREQLARSQQLAQQLTQQLQEQQNQPGQRGQQAGGRQPGQQPGQQQGGQQQGGQQQGGQQQGGQAGGGGQQQANNGQRQIGGGRGDNNNNRVGGGVLDTSGNNSPIGNARSIRQQLTQQDIEDFLNQPDLFKQLLQPILDLEGALRAQAELDNINNKLYASVDEEIPDEYRDLVEEYYRVLSENQGSQNTANSR